MNDRSMPYEFRAFSEDGYIYLFDNSEDCYLCSLTPAVWCECIDHCPCDPDQDIDPHYNECSHYRDRKWIDKMITVQVCEVDPDLDKANAWEHAMEMVVCNNYGGLY